MSIRLKLVIICIALVFLVMVATGTYIIYALRGGAASEARDELGARVSFIYFNVIDDALRAVDFNSPRWVDDFESRVESNFEALRADIVPADTEVFIVCVNSRHVLQSNAGRFDQLTNSVIISAMAGTRDFSAFREFPNLQGEIVSWFEYARPVFLLGLEGSREASHLPYYVIYARMSANEFLEGLSVTTNTILLGGALALGIATLLGIAFSIPLTQNLVHLNRMIKSFKVGGEPVSLIGANDEVGQIAESFNTMSQDLNEHVVILANEKNKMEIVMYNMTDGVLAYDRYGVLIHSNHAGEELLGLAYIQDLPMTELFDTLGIELPDIDEMDNKEDVIIERGDKYVNATFNTHKDENGEILGVIIVFQDITKHMRLDNMRKDFVANVSHELRTPLTTIMSYAETILDGPVDDPNMRDDFLGIIYNESVRMAAIIKDLLELSKFDSGRLEFDFGLADLVALVTENVQSHRITAEKQGKTISLFSGPAVANIKMDSARINQVLNNIISNSLRYSLEGAKIAVEIQERQESYLVYIHDDGIGIPKEDLRMIFDRFYRVDKARSRELGGTGLGLSIAREIVEAHGGRINVSSELGVGTTMTLRLPRVCRQ